MSYDYKVLANRLETYLYANGPTQGSVLYAHLGISQATFSRLINIEKDNVIMGGSARSTQYAWSRPIEGVRCPMPIFEVLDIAEEPIHVSTLYSIQPKGFYIERHDGEKSAFYPGLPYFLHDLRPSGFLGRLIPLQHPNLGLAPDIRYWSADETLRFISRFGWNLVGDWIVGVDAYILFLENILNPPDSVEVKELPHRYGELATQIIQMGDPGSSAAGEQPKFLATKRDGNQFIPVLVKFSAPSDSAANRRVADLLIAEHLALQTLQDHGWAAASSALLFAEGRTFLELERFDRKGLTNRVGQLSLEALFAEFAEEGDHTWTGAVAELIRVGAVPASVYEAVQALAYFGDLIGNSDMHMGNLAFTTYGTGIVGLTPVYDMLPMLYAPRNGEVVPRKLHLVVPDPSMAGVAPAVVEAAIDFWGRVVDEERISSSFREIAAENKKEVSRLKLIAAMLPKMPKRKR